MIEQSKYLKDNEKKILELSMDEQVKTLKQELEDKTNFVKKDNSSKLSIMTEEGEE